jgi:branched-chain amino acid transport system ATP-binding protein
MTAMFTCEGLVAGYGSTKIVRGMDLQLDSGSVLAVLGPNGAGKTTLIMTLAGLLPRLGGSLTVAGKALRSGRATAANRAGVVLVPDSRALFSTLTTSENIEAARRRGSPPAKQVLEMFPALEKRWTVKAGALSGGEQQMLAVGRALIQEPRVLLIDEMSLGLAPVIVEDLLPKMRHIAESTGAVVVLVEQHVQLALEVADKAVVLVHGEVMLSGSASDLRRQPAKLESAYLGGQADQPDPGAAAAAAQPIAPGHRLSIDSDRCSGHGRCYALAPQLFGCDELGKGTVTVDMVPDADLEDGANAVATCPEQAIELLPLP